jgi:diacylglycerol O-acyltransferase / wax synthase
LFGAPWLVSGIASMIARSRLMNVVPPIANIVISNVPGSPVPVYFAGAKLASYYPVSIVVHSMALNVTVQSYAGRLDYGLIACRRAMPDLTDLGDYLLAEHQTLLARANEHVAAAQAQADATMDKSPTEKSTVKAPTKALPAEAPVAAKPAAKAKAKAPAKPAPEPTLKLVSAKATAPPRKSAVGKRVAAKAS